MLSVHDQEAANEVAGFIDIVRICLTSGFTEEAHKLIENINLNAQQQQHYPEPRIISARIGSVSYTGTGIGTTFTPNLAHRFVRMLGDLLDAHKAPFMDSLRGLFEYLLRNYALPPLPVYPIRQVGWAHQPRGCGGFCKPCEGLDLFLADPQHQTADFSHKRIPERDHVVRRLPLNLFQCVGLSAQDLMRNKPFLVHKLSQDGEFQEALSAYEVKVRDLRDCAKDLRGEHFRRILGDDLYSELVLLESLPGSRASVHPYQTAVGLKREAEEELIPPPRPGVRPWIL